MVVSAAGWMDSLTNAVTWLVGGGTVFVEELGLGTFHSNTRDWARVTMPIGIIGTNKDDGSY